MNIQNSHIHLSAVERLTLIQTLSELPLTQLGQLEFALKVPNAVMPGMAAPVGDRAKALLNWAEGPTGPGLALVHELAQMLLAGPHWVTQPQPQPQPLVVQLVVTIDGDTQKLTMAELLGMLHELRSLSGENPIEIKRVEDDGSIRCALEGSPASLHHIRLLYQIGLLTQLLDRSVLSVQFEACFQAAGH